MFLSGLGLEVDRSGWSVPFRSGADARTGGRLLFRGLKAPAPSEREVQARVRAALRDAEASFAAVPGFHPGLFSDLPPGEQGRENRRGNLERHG